MWTWGGVALCGAALLAAGPPPVTYEQSPDTLRFSIVVPDSARPGESVPIALRLTNPGVRPMDLYLTGRSINFDIIIARPDGEVVWHRLQHVAAQQILQVKHLAPGETLELTDRWHQRTDAGAPLTPGDYVVTGVIPTDRNPLRTTPARLRIMSRH